MFHDLEQWIADVRRAEPAVAVMVKKLERPGIQVSSDLTARDLTALTYRVRFDNCDGSFTTLVIRFKDRQSRAHLVVTNMTTLPDTKTSRGHGARAVTTLRSWAKENKLSSILAVQVSDPRSKNFWMRCGFTLMPAPNPTSDYGILLK